MCGIVGGAFEFLDPQEFVGRMLDAIAHRGPDAAGVWSRGGLGLGHRRLSIIDVSPAGHQPMRSACGRFVIVFNGEIYNYTALRKELEQSDCAPDWTGHSDTEVLLACIAAWGVERAVTRASGMFALAVWDDARETLTLARDRMGEKPLYFGWVGNDFVFGSEISAFVSHPAWAATADRDCLSQYLSLGYYGGTRSMVEGIFRLPAGTLLCMAGARLRQRLGSEDLDRQLVAYWSVERDAAASLQPAHTRLSEASAELERLLEEAVARQMVADVPLGAFLSGGFDSSLVVALMQRRAMGPVKTFCIGFDDAAHDETMHARRIALHLGTEHHEARFDERTAADLVPELASTFDDPLADPSQLPTLLVSRLARQSVKVALTGDGGDELFAGYARYPAILRHWTLMRRLPSAVARWLSTALGRIADAEGARFGPFRTPTRAVRYSARHRGLTLDALRRGQIGGPSPGLRAPSVAADRFGHFEESLSPLRQLLLADQIDYLPFDILIKVDRAAMSQSLETRLPLLDPTVVAFSWTLPDQLLLDRATGKRVLREVAYRHIPRALLDRPKQGFAPPIGKWLRGALRPWAESQLADLPSHLSELVDSACLRHVWSAHQAQDTDAGYWLWRVLMYVAWARHHRIAD